MDEATSADRGVDPALEGGDKPDDSSWPLGNLGVVDNQVSDQQLLTA